MSDPFISICIPTYKNVAYLQRLLESISIQKFRDFEIVVTDNSPDTSVAELVNSFEPSLSIRYYKNDPPTNMGENFNRVLQKGNGKWIKMMHDDDWFASADALQKFAHAAAATDKKFIFSACNHIYSPSGKEVDEYLTGWKKEMLEENALNLFYLNVIGHPSAVMHRKDDSVLYDPGFSWVVDVDFYIRYLNLHPGFEYIPEMLVKIGVDENQASNKYYKNPAVEIPEYFTLLAKFPPGLLLQHEYIFHLVWNLVKRFKIRSAGDVARYGYTGALPDKFEEIIQFQKYIPTLVLKQTPWSKWLMKRCYQKLKN